jgi:uncharacterized membrane protein YdbT with pleckstrin-like domain
MSQADELAEGEQPVLILHPHWKTLVGPFTVSLLIVAALLVAEVMIPNGSSAGAIRLAALAVAFLLLMVWLMVPVLRWRTTMYEMTTRRLRMREGVIARSGRDIPLSRITDVSFSKSLLDRMLGSGRLVVESAGEHGEVVLTEIPNVERVQSLLFQLVEDERTRVDQAQEERRRLD